MSTIYKGKIIETELSKKSKGGTEMQRNQLLELVSKSILSQYAIHCSRTRKIYKDVKNVFWAHDLPQDPESKHLEGNGHKIYDKFIFVSEWQKQEYFKQFPELQNAECHVIRNSIQPITYKPKVVEDKVRLIYHTTPHRGLELLVPVFEYITKNIRDDIHLDVFSSFEIYGWNARNEPYRKLFEMLGQNPNATYHGYKPNIAVRNALKKAHIFAYPSIWKETSCIAMIEAMSAGCVCVHSDLGALPETSNGMSACYEFLSDRDQHATRFANVLLGIIDKFKSQNLNETCEQISTYTNEKYDRKNVAKEWIRVLTT